MIAMSKKLLLAGLLTTIAAIALGTAYFSFSRKENPMEQTHVENTIIPPTDAPAPTRVVDTNVPPIDASAPAHTETATFALG
jgi:hypothetical protein